MTAAAKRVTHAERHAQILAARAEGLTNKHIARRLGVSYSQVVNILADPDGSKARARRRRYQGVCADCGGPTDGSNGASAAPTVCIYCKTGKPRSQRPPDRRRCVAVRLEEIPLDRRLEAAREACRIEKGDLERTEILFAALHPSDRTYWIAA